MKSLNVKNVKDAFVELLNENGTATTLDVKKALRKADYFATQEFVSNTIINLVKNKDTEFLDMDVIYTDNGNYRVYTKVTKTDKEKDKNDFQSVLDELNNNFGGLIYFY